MNSKSDGLVQLDVFYREVHILLFQLDVSPLNSYDGQWRKCGRLLRFIDILLWFYLRNEHTWSLQKKITKANNEMKIIFRVYDPDDDDYYNGREA